MVLPYGTFPMSSMTPKLGFDFHKHAFYFKMELLLGFYFLICFPFEKWKNKWWFQVFQKLIFHNKK